MRKLTIIMVAKDHLDLTQRALRTLDDTTDPEDYKLYFYDNGSDEETNSWVMSFCKDNGIECRYMAANFNRGWIACINNGYRLADTEFILTVHNDVAFPKYWMSHMMRRLEDEQVAAVGPVITFAMGPQSKVIAHQYFGCEPKFLLGLFFMCRKLVLEEIRIGDDYLASEYGLGDKEELELCYRIRRLGYKFKIAYDVVVEHEGEKGFVDTLGTSEKFHEYQNRQLEILVSRLGQSIVNDIYSVDLKNPIRLMIGMLTRDTLIHYKFHFAMLGLWGKLFTSGIVKQISSYHIGRGHPTDRNTILKAAIKQGFTHVLFIDDDMVFDDDAAVRMIEHDVDICTGVAFQRGEPHAPCTFYTSPEKEVYPVPLIKRGLVEIDACGGYFLLIKLDSIKSMEDPYFKWGDLDLGYCTKDGGIGEDIYFGIKAKMCGALLYCDSDIDITHIGDERMINIAYYEEYRDSGKLAKSLEANGLKAGVFNMKLGDSK